METTIFLLVLQTVVLLAAIGGVVLIVRSTAHHVSRRLGLIEKRLFEMETIRETVASHAAKLEAYNVRLEMLEMYKAVRGGVQDRTEQPKSDPAEPPPR